MKHIVITGPTAGGKSALALALARRLGAVVVNADSMQVYRELRILTARPSPADEALAEHRLYGHVPAGESYSAGRFVREATAEIARAEAAGRPAVVVGGTGLYLEALLVGLSPIPPIPDELRARVRDMAAASPDDELHRWLCRIDPEMASRLAPTDTQRVTRAIEVQLFTGRSLALWQREPGTPAIAPERTVRIALVPARAELHRRCEVRAAGMLEAGVLDEIRALAALGLPPTLPAIRAVGVPPLLAHVRGEIELTEAMTRLVQDTRQYVKRQTTWLARTRFPFDIRAEETTDALLDKIAVRATTWHP